MKSKILLVLIFLLAGCSTTVVWAPKYITVDQEGKNQKVDVDATFKGSDIDDLHGSQSAEGTAKAK